MNAVEHQLFDALHEIMGLDPAEQTPYPSPYLFKINNEPLTIELVDVIQMYLPEDAPDELTDLLGYDQDSVPPENYRVLLSAEINIPTSVTNYEVAYREILKLNYFGLATKGCTFGLHPEDNQMVQMHYLIPIRLTDLTTKMLELFITGFLHKKDICHQAFSLHLLVKHQDLKANFGHAQQFIKP